MDFFIEDTVEKKEENVKTIDDTFIKGYLTFVDFNTFGKEYMKSLHYNDPTLSGIGQISLQSPSFMKENDSSKLL